MNILDRIALTLWEIPFIPVLLMLWALGCALNGAIFLTKGKSRWIAAASLIACIAGLALVERTPSIIKAKAAQARTHSDQ